MIGLEGVTLRSERLELRLLNEADKEALSLLLHDRSVTEPAGFLPAEDETAFDGFFAKLTQYNTGIAIVKSGELIGYIHVNKYVTDEPAYKDKPCVSTGFVIGKQYQGHGYATETLETVTEYLKRRFAFCFADHFADNEPSRRVIVKCGYKPCGQYSMYFDELGRTATCLRYVY